MPTITTKDGVDIFYKDWGKGQPIVFSHGWPLSADDWDAQMLFFLNNGYRVIAHDRRGHGRSTQTDGGHDMDHYADDLAALTEKLDLKDAVHVGHSTGGVMARIPGLRSQSESNRRPLEAFRPMRGIEWLHWHRRRPRRLRAARRSGPSRSPPSNEQGKVCNVGRPQWFSRAHEDWRF